MSERLQTYAEFWPYYLREHSEPSCRALHYVGTLAGLSTLITAAITAQPWLVLAALPIAYGPAWVGHFFIEKNRPASFDYPLWSMISDVRMCAAFLSGRKLPRPPPIG